MSLSYRIIQLSDLHFSLKKESSLVSLNRTLHFLPQEKADLVVITGDLTDKNDEESYLYFLSAYQKATNIPLAVTPGNHDSLQKMQQLFAPELLPFEIDFSDWKIIILNSAVEEQDHGFIAEEALSQLQERLLDHSSQQILLFTHHHPLPVNSLWLDQYILENSADLFQIIDTNPTAIKGLFHGHIHQPSEFSHPHFKIYGTPSTSSQYQPNNDSAVLISNDTYYRNIQLFSNGSIDTKIVRITDS